MRRSRTSRAERAPGLGPTLVLGLVILVSPGPGRAATADSALLGFLRGAVVSCPRSGQIWGTPDMTDSLRALRTVGVEWAAIHPYGWVDRTGEVRFRPAISTPYLADAVHRARDEGVELFWKPHLGYWGSFEWRGAIQFGGDEERWDRFFRTYRDFIVDQAAFAEAHGIRLFAVGVELEGTTRFEQRWRDVIAAVRSVYRGTLVYAANWSDLEKVPFWDAVDWIGVHGYYPLSQGSDPTLDELVAAWDEPLARLEALSSDNGGKPVLFAEIGYGRSPVAASRPWTHGTADSPAVRELRRRLFEAALLRIPRSPVVRGMFWWKWMPGAVARGDFSLRDPEALEALRTHWGSGPAAEARTSVAATETTSQR